MTYQSQSRLADFNTAAEPEIKAMAGPLTIQSNALPIWPVLISSRADARSAPSKLKAEQTYSPWCSLLTPRIRRTLWSTTLSTGNGLPSARVHSTRGWGRPVAKQCNSTVSPSSTAAYVGWTRTVGRWLMSESENRSNFTYLRRDGLKILSDMCFCGTSRRHNDETSAHRWL